MVVPKKSTSNEHAKFIPFWHSVSTKPTILGRAKQPMRIQLDECNNVGQTSEVRKYCVISLSSKSVSICIDSILTEWNPLWSIAQLGHNYDAEEWKMFHTWGLFVIKARTELFYRPHPVGGNLCISPCRNKTALFRATYIFVEEFATIELMCLAYFRQQSKTDQIISLTSPY